MLSTAEAECFCRPAQIALVLSCPTRQRLQGLAGLLPVATQWVQRLKECSRLSLMHTPVTNWIHVSQADACSLSESTPLFGLLVDSPSKGYSGTSLICLVSILTKQWVQTSRLFSQANSQIVFVIALSVWPQSVHFQDKCPSPLLQTAQWLFFLEHKSVNYWKCLWTLNICDQMVFQRQISNLPRLISRSPSAEQLRWHWTSKLLPFQWLDNFILSFWIFATILRLRISATNLWANTGSSPLDTKSTPTSQVARIAPMGEVFKQFLNQNLYHGSF